MQNYLLWPWRSRRPSTHPPSTTPWPHSRLHQPNTAVNPRPTPTRHVRGPMGWGPGSPWRWALTRLQRVGWIRSLWRWGSYPQWILDYQQPTRLPPHEVIRPWQYNQEGKLICKWKLVFWGRNIMFLPPDWFVGVSPMAAKWCFWLISSCFDCWCDLLKRSNHALLDSTLGGGGARSLWRVSSQFG